MASTSSVPAVQFTDAGLALPTESQILAALLADIDAAFGSGMNPALETPQGQLASTLAALIAAKNAELLTLVNQVDPRYASGRFQDALGALYFLTRKPARSTIVAATLTGLAGTLVPAGTLARDTEGNTYASVAAISIGSTGSVLSAWANVQPGPIPCAAGALAQVYQSVPGWDTISNAEAGVLGADVESRAQFEARRQASVAVNGAGSVAAIYGAVMSLPDVVDAYVIDNPTGAAVDVGATDYSVAAHSVYVAAVGGSDADVAAAIWSKKDVGCDYNGNTTITVTDPAYNYPRPEYDVKFERPAAVPILFAVQIAADSSPPADVSESVKAAIVAKFTGADGTTRERIGSAIFASRYYAAVAAAVPGVAVVSLLIGTSTATLTRVDIGIDQYPTLDAADISVTLV